MSSGLSSLSVVMPNRNHAKYLPVSLDAILSQSYRPTEVIVVDDASTDDSRELVLTYARRDPIVRLVVNERNVGNSVAFNNILPHLRGDYVYGAAADDMVRPGFFERSMLVLGRYPRAALCFCDGSIVDDRTGRVVLESSQNILDTPTYLDPGMFSYLIRTRSLHVPDFTTIMKREALIAAGGLPSSLGAHSHTFITYSMGFRTGLCYVPEPLVAVRRRQDSVASSLGANRAARLAVVEEILRLLQTPTFRDVLPYFKRTGFMGGFRIDLLRAALRHPSHLRFLGPAALVRLINTEIRVRYGSRFPRLARWYDLRVHRWREHRTGNLRSRIQ